MKKETKLIITELKKLKNLNNLAGMARYGINTENAMGISIKELRKIANKYSKNHDLALELWNTEIHEARILATIIDDPDKVTKKQMNAWVKDFNSWDLCDQCCNNLFRKIKFLNSTIIEWVKSRKEFERRAGFVLIAVQAVHHKNLTNEDFRKYFSLIVKYATDERNYVKKAVNWALRQIGKRNKKLNEEAQRICRNLIQSDSKSAKWIGRDALRELASEKILSRISLVNP